MTWFFRNRIALNDKQLISESDDTRVLDSGDVTVRLKIAGRGEHGNVNVFTLEGGEYATPEDALNAGRLWRQRLSVTFARYGVAAEFDSNPLPQRDSGDFPVDPHMPGLLVRSTKQILRMEGFASGYASRPLDRVLGTDLSESSALVGGGIDRQLELAFDLVHLALSATNVDVRFILWVSAVEALIPNEMPLIENVDAITYFDELIAQVGSDGKYNARVRKKVINALERGKYQNITDVGASLARLLDKEYDGLSADIFFRQNYAVRSTLVHGNADESKRIGREEVQRRETPLRSFVGDLLDAVLKERLKVSG